MIFVALMFATQAGLAATAAPQSGIELAPSLPSSIRGERFTRTLASRDNSQTSLLAPAQPIPLTPPDGFPSNSPVIAVDPSGNYWVAWVDERDGNKDIYVAKVSPTGSFLVGPLNISQSAGTPSVNPDIAIDAAGNAHICWQEGTANGEGAILLSRVNAAGVEYLNNLIVSASFSAYPAVTATGTGETWLGFRRREAASLYRIYSAKVNVSGVKACETRTADNSLLELDNSVSIDWNSSGQVIATFHDIYNFQEFVALQVWSGNCAAGCAGGCGSRCQWFNSNNVEHPSLTSPAQNSVYVVFENDPGSGRGIYSLTACNGAALVSDTPGPAVNPSISTPEAIDWALVVWEDRSNAQAEIRLRNENRLTPSAVVSAGPGNSRSPDIAVKSAANWGAVWENDRSGLAEVYFTSTEAPDEPGAPTGLTAALNCPPTVTLQWTDNSNNETAFEIEIETNGSATWVLQATVPTNTVAWTSPTPLAYGSSYAFRVRACNLTYCSAYAISSPVTPPEPSILLEGTVSATVIERVSNNTPREEVLPGIRVLLVRGVNREPILATEADEQGHYQLVANVRCDDQLAVELANPDLQIEDRNQVVKAHCTFDMSATYPFPIPTEYPMDLRWPVEIDGISGDGPNAYYWIERVWREYWRDQMGLGPSDRIPLRVLVEVPREVGKYYDCTDGTLLYRFILFGSKFPRYRSAVLHEFTHNVVRKKAGDNRLYIGPMGESYPEAESIEEAFADYFTASYANDPQIHAWNVLGFATDLELRNIAANRNMPACGGDYQYSGDGHHDGMALAGALWDWRNRLRDDRSVPTIEVDRTIFDLIDDLAADQPVLRKFVRLRELLAGTTLGLQYPTDLTAAFDSHNIKFPADDNCPRRPQVTQGVAWVDESGRHTPISWTSIAEATGYRVYAGFFPRSAFGLGTGIVVADSITATSFEFVDPDTTYVPAFVVAALNSAGEEIGFSQETPLVTAVIGEPAAARSRLSVFPNPATSRLRIEFGEPLPAGARVEVFDVRGRVVRALQATGLRWVEWDGRTVDGREVDSGVFFIRLASGRTTVTVRSVLVR